MNSSVDGTSLDGSVGKSSHASANDHSDGGEQSDTSVELILVNKEDTRRRLGNYDSVQCGLNTCAPNNYIGGDGKTAGYIVIAPQIENIPNSTSQSHFSTIANETNEENSITSIHGIHGGTASIHGGTVNGVMGFDGYYTCEGHSVESVLETFRDDTTDVNMPLDLSKPSKRVEESSQTLDLSKSALKTQKSNETLDLSIEKPKNSAAKEDKPYAKYNSIGAQIQNDCAQMIELNNSSATELNNKPPAATKRRSIFAEKSSETGHAHAPSVQNVTKKSRTGSRSKREEPSQCSFCSKWFCSSWSRISHERTHTGQNRFYCKVCHRSFPTQHNHTKTKDALPATSPDVKSTTSDVNNTSPGMNKTSAQAESTTV